MDASRKLYDPRVVLPSSDFYGAPVETAAGDRDLQNLIIGIGIGFALACVAIALGAWVIG